MGAVLVFVALGVLMVQAAGHPLIQFLFWSCVLLIIDSEFFIVVFKLFGMTADAFKDSAVLSIGYFIFFGFTLFVCLRIKSDMKEE